MGPVFKISINKKQINKFISKFLVVTHVINLGFSHYALAENRQASDFVVGDKNNEYLINQRTGLPILDKDGNKRPIPLNYLSRVYKNPIPIKNKLTSEELHRVDALANHYANDYRSSAALIHLKESIDKMGGLTVAHDLFAYPFSGKATPGYMHGPAFEEIKKAKDFGNVIGKFANIPYSSEPDAIGTGLDAISLIPVVGKGADFISTGRDIINIREFYANKNYLINALKSNKGILSDLPAYRERIKEELKFLFEMGFNSDSISSAINEIAGPINGRLPMSMSVSDLRKSNESFFTKEFRQNHEERLNHIERSTFASATEQRNFDEWKKSLFSIPPAALDYLSKAENNTLTEGEVFGLAEHVKKKNSLIDWDDPKNSVVPHSDASGHPQGKALTPEEKQKIVNELAAWREVFDGIESLAAGKSKGVQAAAAVASTGVAIAMIALSSLPGGVVVAAIAVAVLVLVDKLSKLFSSSESEHEILKKEIEKLQAQVRSVMNKMDNEFSALANENQSFRQLIEQSFDALNGRLHTESVKAQQSQLHQEDMAHKTLNAIHLISKQVQGNFQDERIRGERNCYDTLECQRFQNEDYTSTGFKTEKEARDAMDWIEMDRAYNTFIDNGVNGSRDSISIGVDANGKVHLTEDPDTTIRERLIHGSVDDAFSYIGRDFARPEIGINLFPKASPLRIIQNKQRFIQGTSKSDTNGDYLSNPVSVRDYERNAYNLIAHLSPKKFPSKFGTKLYGLWLHGVDPKLKKLADYIDTGVNQKDAFLSIFPVDSKGRRSLFYIARLLSQYEKSLEEAHSEISSYINDLIKNPQSETKGYDLHKSLSSQEPRKDLISKPGFLFKNAERPSIPPCPGYKEKDKDGGELKTPDLQVTPNRVEQYAKFIPKEFLVAKDILGGEFEFCYEDVGVDQLNLNTQHWPDEDGLGHVNVEHKGYLGFSLRISYKSPKNGKFFIDNIRLTDKTKERSFYFQEYYPVWSNYFKKSVRFNEKTLDLSKISQSDKQKMDWVKHENRYGDFNGWYPSDSPSVREEWDRRFEYLQGQFSQMEWDMVAGAPGKKDTLVAKGHLPEQLDTKESIEDIQKSEKNRLEKVAEIHFQEQLSNALVNLEKSVEQGTGPLFEKMKKVDGARARVIIAMTLGLGDIPEEQKAILDGLNELPGSGAFLMNIHPQLRNIYSSDDKRALLLSNMKQSINKVYEQLLIYSSQGKLIPHHNKLDLTLHELMQLYWNRVLADQMSLKISDLPGALRSYFKDDEALKKAIKEKKSIGFKFNSPTSFLSPKLLSAIHDLDEHLVSKRIVSPGKELDVFHSFILGLKPIKEQTPEGIYNSGLAYAKAYKELVHTAKKSPADAVAFLKQYSGLEAPSDDEIKMRHELSSLVESEKDFDSKELKSAIVALSDRRKSLKERMLELDVAKHHLSIEKEERVRALTETEKNKLGWDGANIRAAKYLKNVRDIQTKINDIHNATYKDVGRDQMSAMGQIVSTLETLEKYGKSASSRTSKVIDKMKNPRSNPQEIENLNPYNISISKMPGITRSGEVGVYDRVFFNGDQSPSGFESDLERLITHAKTQLEIIKTLQQQWESARFDRDLRIQNHGGTI